MPIDAPSFMRRRTARWWSSLRRFGAVYVALVIGAGAFVTGFFYGQEYGRDRAFGVPPKDRLVRILNLNSLSPPLEQTVDFRMFWEVWNDLKTKFYKQPVEDKTLFYGSLQGMVSALGDPYSVFFEPTGASTFGNELQGKLQGIGAEIGMKKEQIVVISPLPDAPAIRAGIKAGDRILAINGESTAGMSVELAVSKIRGPKGTIVTLTLTRAGAAEPFEKKITRDEIHVRSIRTHALRTPGGKQVARFEVRQFAQDTASLFDEEVRRALGDKPAGIILDLRNDPGGYLDAAVAMAGLWIESGVVLLERDGSGNSLELKTEGSGALSDLPTVVLINQGSASASEILAGALQDHGVAVVVGKTSFGKGSVQDYRTLSDGSALKLTIAEWLTPKGRTIQEQGIVPDIDVAYDETDFNEDRDTQIEKALEIIDAGGRLPPVAP